MNLNFNFHFDLKYIWVIELDGVQHCGPTRGVRAYLARFDHRDRDRIPVTTRVADVAWRRAASKLCRGHINQEITYLHSLLELVRPSLLLCIRPKSSKRATLPTRLHAATAWSDFVRCWSPDVWSRPPANVLSALCAPYSVRLRRGEGCGLHQAAVGAKLVPIAT
jgi:hypothetical protein